MSGGLMRGLFAPDLPRWACEFRPNGVVVVGSTADRKGVLSSASRAFADGALTPDVKGVNVQDSAAVGATLESALREARFAGSELIVVIPDDAVRITILDAESLPGVESERVQFIRWKLKKHVPFDVSLARVAYSFVSTNGVTRLVVVLSPQSVTRQYERVVMDLGLHPGIVCPSTTAALNLARDVADTGDRLFVKIGPEAIVSAIVRGDLLRFYRKVPRSGRIEESVHPTLMYYQDHLGGEAGGRITDAILCADIGDAVADREARAAVASLGLDVRPLYSPDVPDFVKPALGALQS